MATVERMTGSELRLRQLLTNAGLRDLKHLAQVTGIPQSTVWRYFHEAKRRTGKLVRVMAQELGVTEEELERLMEDRATRVFLYGIPRFAAFRTSHLRWFGDRVTEAGWHRS